MASSLIRSFHVMMGRLGLPVELSPHATRHTAATNTLYAGVPLQVASYILGHADTAITAKTYSHALPRGAARGWTPPPGLGGLDLLESWYARADLAAQEGVGGQFRRQFRRTPRLGRSHCPRPVYR